MNSETLDRLFPGVHQQLVHLIIRGAHTVEFGFEPNDSFRCIIDQRSGVVAKRLSSLDLLETALFLLLVLYFVKKIKV